MQFWNFKEEDIFFDVSLLRFHSLYSWINNDLVVWLWLS